MSREGTSPGAALGMFMGFRLSPEALESGRDWIRARRPRVVRDRDLARSLRADLVPVAPWPGSSRALAALAAARSLLWEACLRGELRETEGAWGHKFWVSVR
jgi:hypothetical protein